MLRIAATICLLVLSAACAHLPRAELQAYREAFDAVNSAAEPLITDYAVNERAVRRKQREEDSSFVRSGYFSEFEPADVAAFSGISQPPGASALQRGLAAIAGYNETLIALADNRNIDEARAQLQETIGNLTGIAGDLAPGVAVPEAPIQAAGGLVLTALSPLIQIGNREEFKRRVLGGYPKVRALIVALRDYTPTQYSIATDSLRNRWVREPANRPQIAAQINTIHRAYADYVALLNALETNLTALHAAVENPRATALLARASSGSAELRAYSAALRRSIAEVRAAR